MLFNASTQFLNQSYFDQKSEMKNLCYAMIHLLLLIKELSRNSLIFFFWLAIFIRTLKIRGFKSVLKKIYL